MERDLEGGSDPTRELTRDLGDEMPGALRDAPHDPLAPIDASAPVSGHVPAAPGSHAASIAESPEHDWSAASVLIYPLLRPLGTQGLEVATIDAGTLTTDSMRSHSQPLVDEGPCDLVVVYAMRGTGFDVIVNGDHLLSWGVAASDIQDAAMRNLAAWSAGAAWTDEVSGERRLISSDTGDGWDASRVLLPDVLQRLESELGGDSRILVGLPERHLLIAGALRPTDDEFATLFAEFVLEASGGADEPVDRRVFELVGRQLVEFNGLPAPA
jgi:Protein of unknown function (DUF1444)